MYMNLAKRLAIALTAAILIGGATQLAHAGLIEVDLVAANDDDFITRDTATGLDWLDVNLTINTSFNDILLATTTFASLGNKNPITDLGFVHATTAQVATFFANAGIPILSNTYNSANFIPTSTLVDLVGITFTVGQPNPRFGSVGYTSDGPISTSSFAPSLEPCAASTAPGGVDCLGSGTGAFDKARVRTNSQSAGKNFSSSNGHWLIRSTPVPEPTTLAIFSLGLAGLGFARRRKAA